MNLSFLKQALEEISDGVTAPEPERVLYARLTDMSLLDQAKSWEHQEQWEIRLPKTEKNGGKGRIRVRKTVKPDQAPEYVQTIKTLDPRTGTDNSTSIPVTEDVFEQFKIMAETGMIKDRYFYPVEGTDLQYEVDMFLKDGAQPGSKDYHDWCKIDLELPTVADLSSALPPLPQGFVDVISEPFGRRSEADEARVSSLYKNEFSAANPFLRIAAQTV